MDTLDSPSALRVAVVALDDDQLAPGDLGGLDCGDRRDRDASRGACRRPHSRRSRVCRDLRLEDMRRRRSVDWSPPVAVWHPREDELLLDAGQRYSHPSARAEGCAAQVGDERFESSSEVSGSAVAVVGRGAADPRRAESRPRQRSHDRAPQPSRRCHRERTPTSRAIDPPRLLLGKQPIKKRANDALRIPAVPDGQR